MLPALYPDFSWFTRTIRILPVVAGAALLGGAIGGVSVYAIDSALTAPPRQDLRAEANTNNQTVAASAPSPIRTIDAPALNPSPAATPVQAQKAPSAPPQTQVQAAPTQPRAWPDALSRTPQQTPTTSEAATSPSAPTTVTDSRAQDDRARATANNPPAESQTGPEPKSADRSAPVKRRVVKSRTTQPKGDAVSESADNATAARPRRVYDYYGDARDDQDRDDQGGTALANVHLPRGALNAAPKTRIIVRRQAPAYADRSNRSEAASQLPPQPRPAFFGGLFGRGGDSR